MNQKIILPRAVRLFRKLCGDQSPSLMLSDAQLSMAKGTRVTIGEPCTMVYDHRDQLVVPVINDNAWNVDYEMFIVVEEIGKLNSRRSA